jgi:hypothetical protein
MWELDWFQQYGVEPKDGPPVFDEEAVLDNVASGASLSARGTTLELSDSA